MTYRPLPCGSAGDIGGAGAAIATFADANAIKHIVARNFTSPSHPIPPPCHTNRMPKGPQGQKRPADSNACAVMVAKIATGEVEETLKPKDPAAIARGKVGGAKGGPARAAASSQKQKRIIAKKAAKARWRHPA